MANSMQTINYLNIIPYSSFNSWDVKYFLKKDSFFKPTIPLVLFGEFLSKSEIKKVNIEDNNTYEILGVRSYGKGAFINREVKGNTLKMRVYQQAKPNHLFWCKVDTKNGAFGIITEELSKGLGSSNMTFAEIDIKKANVDFIQILFKSKRIYEYLDGFVTGTTNRKYIRPDQLINEIFIPLPTLEEQNRIVASYNAKLQLAQQQKIKAKTLETEIERYLFEELGVEKMIVKPFVKGVLNVFNFSEIFDRWDYNKGSSSVFSILHQSKYPVKTLDEVFNFTNRSWNKKSHKESTFTYVEMGGIDAGLGIVETTNLEVSKAPSRATQTILKGDLIIGTTRPYLKKFAIVTEKNNENIASSAFQIIAPSEDYCLDYLLEYIKSEFGVKQFEYYMTGALYPAITSKDLRRVLIPFPPVEKQKQISGHMNSLKTQIKELNVLSSKNKEEAIVEFEKEIFN